jgi:fermentation-respiration switch protein FrsA (DUF1100 family)
VRRVAIVSLGVLLGAGLLLAAFERSLIYYPTRELVGSPRDLGMAYESVAFRASDGVELHGWWIPASHERAPLLFLHGNAGNISDRLESIRIFHELGLTVFIVDYRGYGQSRGRPSERGTYRDAEGAWRYLVQERGVDPTRLVVFGRSLGAAVATWLAVRHRPAALILESAFTSVPDMAKEVFSILNVLPARLLVRTRYDNLSRMPKLGCPVLIAHSREDEIIPYEHDRRLLAAAPEPKQHLEMRFGHNDGFVLTGRAYTRGIDEFLRRHLGDGERRSG